MFEYSPAEKEYIKNGFKFGLRSDGRAVNQRRHVHLVSDTLDNLAGSSYLRIDHGKCEIYTGIKLKVVNSNESKL